MEQIFSVDVRERFASPIERVAAWREEPQRSGKARYAATPRAYRKAARPSCTAQRSTASAMLVSRVNWPFYWKLSERKQLPLKRSLDEKFPERS